MTRLDKDMWLVACVVIFIIIGIFAAYAKPKFRPSQTHPAQTEINNLIVAAHKVLDMGFDCHAMGTEREMCHAALATAIKKAGYQ